MVGRVLFGHHRRADDAGGNPKDSRRDIVSAFAEYPGRALFVYGTKDPEGMLAYEVYKPFCAEHGLDAEFVLIDGSNHNFHTAAWKREVIEKSVRWLTAQPAEENA